MQKYHIKSLRHITQQSQAGCHRVAERLGVHQPVADGHPCAWQRDVAVGCVGSAHGQLGRKGIAEEDARLVCQQIQSHAHVLDLRELEAIFICVGSRTNCRQTTPWAK